MTWILIAVVLLVAFGPVLWLVPSRKDKRLTALRARGRAEGLVVELRRIPKPDPEPGDRVTAGGRVKTPVLECASYGYTLKRKLRHLPGWRVVRTPESEKSAAPDPLSDWRYDKRPTGDARQYLTEMLELVIPLLEALPGDVVAFEIDPRMLLVYWLEKPGTTEDSVSAVAGLLKRLEGALAGLEEEISVAIDSDDS